MVAGWTWGVVAVGGIACAGAAWSTVWWYAGESCEKPQYTVEKVLKKKTRFLVSSANEVELRRYEPYLVAEATMRDMPMKKAMSKGFMTVAKYIFGDNVKQGGSEAEKVAMTAPVRTQMSSAESEKIAMTAPVQTTVSGSDSTNAPLLGEQTYKISFVMPSSYTRETLPVPNNKELDIKEVAAHRAVALKFNGRSPTPEVIEGKKQQLLAVMQEAGLKPSGDVLVYQYHPPWAPPFIRLNEVLFRVDA